MATLPILIYVFRPEGFPMTAGRVLVVVLSVSWFCGGSCFVSVWGQEQADPTVRRWIEPSDVRSILPKEQPVQIMNSPSHPMTSYGSPTSSESYPSLTEPSPSTTAINPSTSEKSPLRAGDTNTSQPLYDFGAPNNNSNGLGNARPLDTNAMVERTLTSDESWSWQLLPTGLMYKSYLAGGREPRIGSELVHDREHGWLWDATIGGRAGIFRYGADNDLWPQGWQFDIEGAAFPRLDLDHDEDFVAVDFRGGFLSTTRQGPFETKFGFYHLSSHLGDEYMIRYPSTLGTRINYVRESLIAGVAVYLNPSLRLYSEVGWTFQEDGGAQPWEFQFGADFSSPEPTGSWGAPFFAINAHLRQENNFGGNMTVQTGLQWRGRTGHLFRVGMQYFNGMSDQYEFFNRFEEQIGAGLWYDF